MAKILTKVWTNMKQLIYFIFIIGLLLFLTATNPSRSEYVNWLNEKALNESTNFFEKGVISLVGPTFSDAATTRSNYYIFSIYTTDFTKIGKGKVKSIGVFNHIFPISKNE